jgi:hypothetical protein
MRRALEDDLLADGCLPQHGMAPLGRCPGGHHRAPGGEEVFTENTGLRGNRSNPFLPVMTDATTAVVTVYVFESTPEKCLSIFPGKSRRHGGQNLT